MMKKNVFTLLFFLNLLSTVWAQNGYQRGFYVDNNNKKIEGYIVNKDYETWDISPTEIKFKLTENSEIQTIDMAMMKEFGSEDKQFHFTKAKVQVDTSSNIIKKYSRNRQPEYKEATLFLRTIISGNVSLLEYYNGEFFRYFYKINPSEEITQLIYKKYSINEVQVKTNEDFRQQLRSLNLCNEVSDEELLRLDYYKKEFVNFFIKLNKCRGSEYTYFKRNKSMSEKNWANFNFNVRLGARFNAVDIENIDESNISASSIYDPDFSKKLSGQAGFEVEYVLPFNNNKWSLILEPTIQTFKDETVKQSYNNYEITHKIESTSIEVPLGIRYYFYLSEKSAIFINTSYYLLNIPLKREYIRFQENTSSGSSSGGGFDLDNVKDLRFGVGYRYNKLSFEIRYGTPTDMTSFVVDQNLKASTQSTSLMLGYRIF